MKVFRWTLAVLGAILILGGPPVLAQSVEVGGRAYVDYFYEVSAVDDAQEGLHGFRYRRLYLTTDFSLSEAFNGRARLEANDGTVGPNGPVPIVKDLWLTWTYSGGHSATLGVTPPPAFGLAEDVWGYRSLSKTLLDRRGIVESRDFGLRLDGPLLGDGTVRYAVMLANNSDVLPETDVYKRVYGQLAVHPSEPLVLVVGGDYAGYGDERDYGTRLSAFAGYTAEQGRVGLEGYWARTAMSAGTNRTDVGASLFGAIPVAPSWELVGRVGWGRVEATGPAQYESFLVGAVAYQPHPNIRLMPNLRVLDRSGEDADTTARFTVEINF